MAKEKAKWISAGIGLIIPYLFYILYLFGLFSEDVSPVHLGVLIMLLIPSLIFAGAYFFAGRLLSRKHYIWAIVLYLIVPIILILGALSTGVGILGG